MNMENYKEKDRFIAAFLLTLKNIKFQGVEPVGDILYFLFSPEKDASKQASLFFARQAEPVQPKDYAEAQQTVINLIWRWRKQRDENGGNNYGRQGI